MESPTLREWICLLITPSGYLLIIRSKCPFTLWLLIGVYGLVTSPFFTTIQLAVNIPVSISFEGNSNLKIAVFGDTVIFSRSLKDRNSLGSKARPSVCTVCAVCVDDGGVDFDEAVAEVEEEETAVVDA